MYSQERIQQLLDYLKENIKISELLAEWGRFSENNIYTCLFHADSRPSFFVDDENGVFFCQSCQRGGNSGKLISEYYAQEYETKSFFEALELYLQLHEEAQIELGFSTLRTKSRTLTDKPITEILAELEEYKTPKLEQVTLNYKPDKNRATFEEILQYCIAIQNQTLDI